MKKYLAILFLNVISISSAWSATATCTYNNMGEIGKTFALPPANITVSAGIADYTPIFTFNRVMVGITQGSCSGGSGFNTSSTLTNMPSSSPALSWNGNIIYPTSVPGIGISIVDNDSSNTGNTPPYPIVHIKYNAGVAGIGGWVNMVLWKIPGNIPLNQTGTINFIGPTYVQGMAFINTADSFSASTNMSYSPTGSTRFWTASSRTLIGSATFVMGTCQLSGGDKTVQMGTLVNDLGPNMKNTPWVDASFSLICPNAYGYGGSYTSSTSAANQYSLSGGTLGANTIKNANLTISILPRTQVVTTDWSGNTLNGAIALDGTGAKGFGIQLAWGSAATQANVPAKPVVFNTPVSASTLNSSYTTGSYTLGAAMPTPLIQMAARFIRISGTTEPGPADTSVEVLANYN